MEAEPRNALTTVDIVRYLIGSRQAIDKIAAARSTLFIGALFVLSAGFAREYDGEYLVAEPWHLGIPLAASLVTSFILHGLLCLVLGKQDWANRFIRDYRTFLSLYWLTAPLAWIYAIPVEQFTSAGTAMQWNLTFLAVVAFWRVILITRVASVLYDTSFFRSFFVVMLFADVLALVIVYFTPIPVFNIMGGVRLSPNEQLILNASLIVGFFGTLTLPIWLIASLIVTSGSHNSCNFPTKTSQYPSRVLWGIAVLSVVIWIPILPLSQPPQRLRWIVESHLQEGNVDAAIDVMTQTPRDLFPPHWEPAPNAAYGSNHPSLMDVMEGIIARTQPEDWAREIYFQKFLRELDRRSHRGRLWSETEADEFDRSLTILSRSPEGHAYVKQHAGAVKEQIDSFSSQSPPNPREEQLRALLATAGIQYEPPRQDDEQEAKEPDAD